MEKEIFYHYNSSQRNLTAGSTATPAQTINNNFINSNIKIVRFGVSYAVFAGAVMYNGNSTRIVVTKTNDTISNPIPNVIATQVATYHVDNNISYEYSCNWFFGARDNIVITANGYAYNAYTVDVTFIWYIYFGYIFT